MGNEASGLKTGFLSIFSEENQQELTVKMDAFLSSKIRQLDLTTIIDDEFREIIEKKQRHLEIFLKYLVLHLECVSEQALTETHTTFIQNILVVLTRIIPYLHERGYRNVIDKIFWNSQQQQQQILSSINNNNTENLEKNKKTNKKTLTNSSSSNNNCTANQNEGLGVRLIYALNRLFMMPGFTVKYNNVAWQTIKHKGDFINSGPKYQESRLLLLKLFIALFSYTLFQPNFGMEDINPWIVFTVSPQNQNLQLIFISLLGQLIQHKDNGLLPYQKYIKSVSKQNSDSLSFASAQVLMVLVNYKFFLKEEDLRSVESLQQIFDFYNTRRGSNLYATTANQPVIENVEPLKLEQVFENKCIFLVKDLNEICKMNPQDVPDFLEFYLELMENHFKYDQTFIPDSFEKISFNEELLSIFYRLIQQNQDILVLITENKQLAKRTFKVVMYNFCKSCEKFQYDNIFFISLAVLIQLSQSRVYNGYLNAELDFSFQFNIFPVVSGTYADLLIQSVITAIIHGFQVRGNTYTYNMMSILYNISPFVKNLSEATGNKLMQLLNVFTNYEFLLFNQYHPFCLIKLIIIFDSILEFQLENNPAVLLEMYRKKNLFNRAMNLTFHPDQIKQLMGKTYELYLKEQKGELDKEEDNEQQKMKKHNEEEEDKTKFYTQLDNLANNWKGFNWLKERKKINIQNILNVVGILHQYIVQNKIIDLDVSVIRIIIAERSFAGIVKVRNQIFVDYLSDQQFIEGVVISFVWMQIFVKNLYQPAISKEKVLFFTRKAIENPLDDQDEQRSVYVEPPSQILNPDDVDNKVYPEIEQKPEEVE